MKGRRSVRMTVLIETAGSEHLDGAAQRHETNSKSCQRGRNRRADRVRTARLDAQATLPRTGQLVTGLFSF